VDASEPEVDRGFPQLSNLNSDFSTVEVSVFYNGCSGFVNEFDDIALGIAEVIAPGRAVASLRHIALGIAEVIVIISVIVHGNDFAVSVVAEAEL